MIWKSKLQSKLLTLSAMAEVYALNDSIDDELWLKNTLEELKPLANTSSLVRANELIKIYEDN